MKLLADYHFTAPELVILYSNLGYTIGASIEGFKEKGPSFKQLQEKYYSSPTLGTSLMLQSLMISTWLDDLEKLEKRKGENQ